MRRWVLAGLAVVLLGVGGWLVQAQLARAAYGETMDVLEGWAAESGEAVVCEVVTTSGPAAVHATLAESLDGASLEAVEAFAAVCAVTGG